MPTDDSFHSLKTLGFSNLSINLDGMIYDSATNQFSLPQNGQYTLPTDKGLVSYKVGMLVGEAWWMEPRNMWENSPYSQQIEDCANFHYLGINDTKVLFDEGDGVHIYKITTRGDVWDMHNMQRLPVSKGSSGYLLCNTYPFQNLAIHRAVALSFIPIPDELKNQGYTFDNLVVNHKDGNKLNNRLSNLEWVTQAYNSQHATKFRQGLKVSDDLLRQVWQALQDGFSDIEIAKKLDMSPQTVSSIRRGISPRYRTDEFTWRLNSPKPKRELKLTSPEIKINAKAPSTNKQPFTEVEKRIVEAFNNGVRTPSTLARMFSLPAAEIINILNRCTDWKATTPTNTYRNEEILTLLDSGVPIRDLAHAFNLSHAAIQDILKKRTKNDESWAASTIDDETLQDVFKALSIRMTDIEIAQRFNLIPSLVRDIRARREARYNSLQYQWPANLSDDTSTLAYKQYVLKLYQQLKSPTAVANMLNISVGAVRSVLEQFRGVFDSIKEEVRDEEFARIARVGHLFQEGCTISEISKMLNAPASTITNWLRKYDQENPGTIDRVAAEKTEDKISKLHKFIDLVMSGKSQSEAARELGLKRGSLGRIMEDAFSLSPEFKEWWDNYKQGQKDLKQQIINLLMNGKSQTEIQTILGINKSALQTIVSRFPEDVRQKLQQAEKARVASLAGEARRLYHEGTKASDVARKLHLQMRDIWTILRS